MDKREFIKASAAGAMGLASTGGAVAADVPAQLSANALSDLHAAMSSQRARSVLAQVELIIQATGSARDRAMFIADPVRFAHGRGIEIDRGFALVMREEMRKVELQAASAINQAKVGAMAKITPSSTSDTAFPLVMAVAAVVSAVSAVVSAVSTTYMATKWNAEIY